MFDHPPTHPMAPQHRGRRLAAAVVVVGGTIFCAAAVPAAAAPVAPGSDSASFGTTTPGSQGFRDAESWGRAAPGSPGFRDAEFWGGATATEAPLKAEILALKPQVELAFGAQNFDIWLLQRRLAELGYFLPAVNGRFDFNTEQALWAVQKVAGIERTGRADAATIAALDAGVVPEPTNALTRGIEIDIDRQLLLTIEDGAVTHIFNASSGSGVPYTGSDGRRYSAQTARGRFSVYKERNYMHESTLGVGSMYRPKYFNGMMAIHGAPEVPPEPSSHGCVRVSDAAMDWLWDTWGIPMRTPVIVF